MKSILISLENFLHQVLLALPRYVIGILVLIIGLYAIKFISRAICSRFIKRDLDITLRGFLISTVKVVLYIILFVAVIGIMGFKSLSLTAIFGAAGLTIGLALQGSLSNFAGGVLILLFRPFNVGDYITNPSGTGGTVEKIDLLYTTIRNDDGLKVFSPNGTLANSVITNYSEIKSRRHDFVVGISYQSDIREAQELILKTMAGYKAVLQTPAPLVFVSKLGANSVDVSVIIWMNKDVYWDTVFKIKLIVKEALDKANIQIAFPQTDVHIVTDKTKDVPGADKDVP